MPQLYLRPQKILQYIRTTTEQFNALSVSRALCGFVNVERKLVNAIEAN